METFQQLNLSLDTMRKIVYGENSPLNQSNTSIEEKTIALTQTEDRNKMKTIIFADLLSRSLASRTHDDIHAYIRCIDRMYNFQMPIIENYQLNNYRDDELVKFDFRTSLLNIIRLMETQPEQVWEFEVPAFLMAYERFATKNDILPSAEDVVYKFEKQTRWIVELEDWFIDTITNDRYKEMMEDHFAYFNYLIKKISSIHRKVPSIDVDNRYVRCLQALYKRFPATKSSTINFNDETSIEQICLKIKDSNTAKAAIDSVAYLAKQKMFLDLFN